MRPPTLTHSNGHDPFPIGTGLTLFEIATGRFPYPVDDLFKQIKAVYEDQPPQLPDSLYSATCHHFITKCLEKDHRQRPNYVQLLEYDFIRTYHDADIAEYTSMVLDSLDAASPTGTPSSGNST